MTVGFCVAVKRKSTLLLLLEWQIFESHKLQIISRLKIKPLLRLRFAGPRYIPKVYTKGKGINNLGLEDQSQSRIPMETQNIHMIIMQYLLNVLVFT